MHVKKVREKALSQETYDELKSNPYLEVWDVDYYSTSDEEDNDDDDSSDEESGDSEVDSSEEEKEGEESNTV